MPPRKSSMKRSRSTTYNKKKSTTDGRNAIVEISIDPTESEVVRPKKKGRGPGIVLDSIDDFEDRQEIWVVGKKEFSCEGNATDITALVTRLALNYMPGPIRSYNSWPKEYKDIMETAFLERFRYAEGQDVTLCRTVLDAIAAKRYTEELNKARTKCFDKLGDNVALWKKMVPHWCLEPSNWVGLCDIFLTEDWKDLSKKNKENRKAAGKIIPHYGGCSSAHQHLKKLTKLKKGVTPTMRELYVHLHSRNAEGKSPVLAKYKESEVDASRPNENSEGAESLQPASDETPIQHGGFDIKDLKFTTERAQKFFTDVSGAMSTNKEDADVDEGDLFMSAVGGASHGRVRGFGCVLDPKLPKTAGRGRATISASDLSGVTNLGNKRVFTDDVLVGMLNERDMRLAEEVQARKRDEARYNMLFNKLFCLVGNQNPTVQGHDLTSLPQSQEGTPLMQMAHSQGLPSNPVGGFQALLKENSVQEVGNILGAESSISEWFGQDNSNNNLH